jgi:hypothetical protein
MSSIPNVSMGQALCLDEVSTTGIFTCICIIGYFSDDKTLIHHFDSSRYNLESDNLKHEAQKMIEKSIEHLNQCNAVGSIREIFILGGVNEEKFLRFEKALLSIKTDFTNLKPINPKVNSSDLQSFMECIKYINITMNYADNSKDYENIDDVTGGMNKAVQTLAVDFGQLPKVVFLSNFCPQPDWIFGNCR